MSNKSCERQRSRTPIANLTERAKRSETVGSSPTVTTTAQPLKIKGCYFFSPRHHCRGVHFFQGSLRRRERLGPPFRSHGRLAQLPENRGGSVGGNEAAFVSFRFCFSLSCVVHYPSVHIDGSISLGSKAKSSTDKSQP